MAPVFPPIKKMLAGIENAPDVLLQHCSPDGKDAELSKIACVLRDEIIPYLYSLIRRD